MEFTKYRLGDIADIKISGVDKKTTPGEQSVRLCNFVDVYRNWAITKELYDSFMVATANNNEISDFTIHKGQVAITKDSETRDDIGIATYISDDFEEPVVLGYHTALITPNEDIILGKYLNALLHTKYFHDYWYNNASGSGMRYTLSELSMRNAVVLLPSIKTQRIVSGFLSSIDKKIAINRRINERLEGMAKLLYDYWFVQFDFPNEEGKPYKSSGGKMVWNEKLKREIPEGWEVKKIGDTITYSRGVSYNGNNLGIVEDLSIPMINLASFTPSGVYNPNGIKYYVGNINEEKLLSPLDLVMCNTQQTAIDFKKDIIGRVLLVPSSFKNKVIASHHVTIIRCNRPNLKYYYYSLFSTDYFHRYIAKHTNGTNILSLNFQGVEDFICPIPTIQLLNKYASFICNFEKQKFNHIYENDRLTALRDFLLPMLMNGQVEIKEK